MDDFDFYCLWGVPSSTDTPVPDGCQELPTGSCVPKEASTEKPITTTRLASMEEITPDQDSLSLSKSAPTTAMSELSLLRKEVSNTLPKEACILSKRSGDVHTEQESKAPRKATLLTIFEDDDLEISASLYEDVDVLSVPDEHEAESAAIPIPMPQNVSPRQDMLPHGFRTFDNEQRLDSTLRNPDYIGRLRADTSYSYRG